MGKLTAKEPTALTSVYTHTYCEVYRLLTNGKCSTPLNTYISTSIAKHERSHTNHVPADKSFEKDIIPFFREMAELFNAHATKKKCYTIGY